MKKIILTITGLIVTGGIAWQLVGAQIKLDEPPKDCGMITGHRVDVKTGEIFISYASCEDEIIKPRTQAQKNANPTITEKVYFEDRLSSLNRSKNVKVELVDDKPINIEFIW